MNIIGVIPARGGSKSIPRKNISLLHGKPLLAYTAETALNSQLLNRVILSTDDEEIATLGRQFGLEVPYLRSSELAKDTTPILPVLQQLLNWLNVEQGYEVDVLVLLQPTSPFRLSHHVDEAITILLEQNADSVVSVVKVPHQFTPNSLMGLEEGVLKWYEASTPTLRRQDKPLLYARNGPAVLISRGSVIMGGGLYGERLLPYVMDKLCSIDIDEPDDIECAEALYSIWASTRNSGV